MELEYGGKMSSLWDAIILEGGGPSACVTV